MTRDTEGHQQLAAYFMAVVTDTNMVWTVVPRRATAPTMANAMPDATTQYSIEVAPDSSLKKAVSSRRINATFLAGRDQTKCPAGRLDG
jgi:hypothetical protein